MKKLFEFKNCSLVNSRGLIKFVNGKSNFVGVMLLVFVVKINLLITDYCETKNYFKFIMYSFNLEWKEVVKCF